jgi:transposase-like protein
VILRAGDVFPGWSRGEGEPPIGRYRKVRTDGRVVALVPKDREERRAMLREGLLSMSLLCGVSTLDEMMREEAEAAAGPKGKRNPDREANHWGSAIGSVVFGGRTVRIERPRVRALDGREVVVPAYEEARSRDLLDTATIERLLAGAATRTYERTLDPIPAEGRGATKSSVSRRFAAATSKRLAELLGRRFDGVRFAAIVLDTLMVNGHAIVVALGIDSAGTKRILGLWEGSTENATVAKALLSGLVERGLDVSKGCLFTIDGSKALRRAVRDVFGEVPVQRCRVHKLRNVVEHLPPGEHAWVARKYKEALEEKSADVAERALLALARALEAKHPGAAASLREGLDEILTTKRLGVPAVLERTLSSTNVIENANGRARKVAHNVKRWRGGAMALRWTAAGLIEAERTFNRVRGYREIPFLLDALARREEAAALTKAA